ncbi:hypothetical protein ACFL5U_03590 [Candidatus Margulisiibacteriota bacterium]
MRSGIPLHVIFENYGTEAGEEWGDLKKWDRMLAKIMYDPHGKIRKLIDNKTRISKLDLDQKALHHLYNAWWYNFLAKIWILRNDLHSAQYIINESISETLKSIFFLNGTLYPHSKWMVYFAKHLSWLPESFDLIFETLKVDSFTSEAITTRSKQLRRIVKECINYFLKDQPKYAYPIFWAHVEWINMFLSIYYNPGIKREELTKRQLNPLLLNQEPLYSLVKKKGKREYFVEKEQILAAWQKSSNLMMDLVREELNYLFKKLNNTQISNELSKYYKIK